VISIKFRFPVSGLYNLTYMYTDVHGQAHTMCNTVAASSTPNSII